MADNTPGVSSRVTNSRYVLSNLSIVDLGFSFNMLISEYDPCIEFGTDYGGKDIKKSGSIHNLEDCLDYCRTFANCKAFTLVHENAGFYHIYLFFIYL